MKLVPILLAVLVSGCATTDTGVVQIADNTYMLGRQKWREQSGSVIKAELYREGNAYCAAKGMKLEPINSTSRDAGFEWASAEIQFACK